MSLTVSRARLDTILRDHKIASNDLKGIDQLFGGADGYYWYHTLKHMCAGDKELSWGSAEEMRAAVQRHEEETAAEDEVKPQMIQDSHAEAMARLLAD